MSETYVAGDRRAAVAARGACPGCGALLGGRVALRGRDRFVGGPGDFEVVECSACGLASTVPQIGPGDFDVYYPDSYQAYAAPEPATASAALRRVRGALDRARTAASVRSGPHRRLYRLPVGRLLDVGCGTGDLALTFRERGWQVAGVEPSASACRHASAAGVDVHRGTLGDAPWTGPTFDAIVFSHSLEHIPQPGAALARAASLLRHGGLLSVSVPNFGSWQRRLFGTYWFQLDLPRHLQHFDAGTLEALMRSAGLTPVERTTPSMRASALTSLQYAVWGRRVVSGRPLRLAALALTPLLRLADAVAEGDCLNVVAVRPSAE